MTNEEHLQEVLRTIPSDFNRAKLLPMSIMGMAGETGELIDEIKKILYADKPTDRLKIIDEAGDMEFYRALFYHLMGITLDEVREYNKNKLRKRYPDGFSFEAANNRKDVENAN